MPTMSTTRPHLYAALDEDTLDAWHEYADYYEMPMAVLAEAIGRKLTPGGRQPTFMREVLAEAKVIKADRKDRRRTD